VIEQNDRDEMEYIADQAIQAKSSWRDAFYRPGFDLAFHLFPPDNRNDAHQKHTLGCHGDHLDDSVRRDILASRKYLLTGKFSFTHPLREKIYQELRYPQLPDAMALKQKPIMVVHRTDSRKQEYCQLMQEGEFGLCPRGNGLHSYRLLETMRAGSIPVIVADRYILPYSDVFDWRSFAVVVPESRYAEIPRILRRIPMEQRLRMRRLGREIYERFFQTVKDEVDLMLRLLRARVYGRFLAEDGLGGVYDNPRKGKARVLELQPYVHYPNK
jgi:hypothetical protein